LSGGTQYVGRAIAGWHPIAWFNAGRFNANVNVHTADISFLSLRDQWVELGVPISLIYCRRKEEVFEPLCRRFLNWSPLFVYKKRVVGLQVSPHFPNVVVGHFVAAANALCNLELVQGWHVSSIQIFGWKTNARYAGSQCITEDEHR
jgi:hypothetical protein